MTEQLWVWRREADGKYITFDGWQREIVMDDPGKACFAADSERTARAYRPNGCVLEMYERPSSTHQEGTARE